MIFAQDIGSIMCQLSIKSDSLGTTSKHRCRMKSLINLVRGGGVNCLFSCLSDIDFLGTSSVKNMYEDDNLLPVDDCTPFLVVLVHLLLKTSNFQPGSFQSIAVKMGRKNIKPFFQIFLPMIYFFSDIDSRGLLLPSFYQTFH